MIGPLLFRPLYQPRIWGGRAIGTVFGRDLPHGRIGESWEIVDRPQEQSVVADGRFAGWRLRDLRSRETAAVMGPRWDAERPFPVLVKWLDCRERLSLQVHPPLPVAASLGGEPKTENWYIARADAGAALIAGLRRGVTRDAFERAIAAHALEPLLHRVAVEEGDSMFVPSGRIHAIDAGNLILEIQQNSDTTYRVYDWGRLGDDGRPRALHLAESMRCIDFGDVEPSPLRPSGDEDVTLAACEDFRIRRCRRPPGSALPLGSAEPRLVSVVGGAISMRTAGGGLERYTAGDNVLVPADTEADAVAETVATVLLTDRFSSG